MLSDPHAVAWTFNIRGADVAHTPLPISYALVPKDGRPTILSTAANFERARDRLERHADVASPTNSARAEAAGGDQGRDRHRCGDRRRRAARMITEAGGKPVRGSDRWRAEGGEERDRNRRHAQRA